MRVIGINGTLAGVDDIELWTWGMLGNGELRCTPPLEPLDGLPTLRVVPPCCALPGVEGNADRNRGVPFMVMACSPGPCGRYEKQETSVERVILGVAVNYGGLFES
jgi:hypothetical protein